KATVQILIEKENPNVVNFKDVLAIDSGDREYYQTQFEILKSPSIALQNIEQLKLERYPEFIPKEPGALDRLKTSVITWIKELPSTLYLDRLFPTKTESGESYTNTEINDQLNSQIKSDSSKSGLLGIYLGNLEVSPVRNSRLVNVSYESLNPKLATVVVNSHARLYREQRRFNKSVKNSPGGKVETDGRGRGLIFEEKRGYSQ
ncbi:MAG: hypothetical protein AAB110_01810, partial [Candidatus Desantisbacteria bacterium]